MIKLLPLRADPLQPKAELSSKVQQIQSDPDPQLSWTSMAIDVRSWGLEGHGLDWLRRQMN